MKKRNRQKKIRRAPVRQEQKPRFELYVGDKPVTQILENAHALPSKKTINVAMDSGTAMIRDIIKAIV